MRASRRSGPWPITAATWAVVCPMATRSMLVWLRWAWRHVSVVAKTQPERAKARRGPTRRRTGSRSGRLPVPGLLLNVEREVIDDEGGLEGRIFSTDQIYLNRLALVRQKAERFLREAGGGVDVRIRGQRRQHRARRIPHLDLQRVVGRRAGFRGIDVEPEGQVRRRRRRGDR